MKIEEWIKENLPDKKRPISASGIITALGCERKFLFANKWRLYRKVKQYSESASFGKLVHRLLEVGRDRLEEVHQEVIKTHGKLMERIKAGEDLTGDLAREANDLHAAYIKAVAVVSIFWDRFPPKDYMETLFREKRIETTMKWDALIEMPVKGYIDWIVKDNRDGSVWIRDAKTTSRKFESVLTGFQWSAPCRFYRILSSLCPEIGEVKGFILDIIKVPTIKLCGKDEKEASKLGCTPLEAYIQRVKDWYAEQEEGGMMSAAISFREPLQNSEIRWALRVVQRMWQDNAVPEMFSKDLTRSSCYAYEKVCPYYDLCNSDPVTWPAQIEQGFEVIKEPEKEERKDNE